MAKRRVFQIVQHLQPGGIETMALDLMLRASPETDVFIASLEGTRDDAVRQWPRLRPYQKRLHFLEKKPGHDISALYQLWQLMVKERIDIVHTHHIGPMLYGGIAARLSNVNRIIHTEHDAWHLQDAKRRRLQRWIMKMVRPTMVADAEMVAGAVRDAIPSATPIVIPNGIDTSRFIPGDPADARRRMELPVVSPIIGCAARLESVKGHRFLLEAVARLPPVIHLALAGGGSLREDLKQRTIELGIEERVHFLGLVEDMPTFHQAIDVFCLPSEKEGLPLSPLEAQACGIPAVLTDVGGCREAVCEETGYLVPPNSPASLASALSAALSKKNPKSPREFVLRHGDLQQTISAYERLHGAEPAN